MYSKIINPKTGRRVNVKNRLGRQILKNYIRVLRGGAVSGFSFITPTPQATPTPPPSAFPFITPTTQATPTPPPSAFPFITSAPTATPPTQPAPTSDAAAGISATKLDDLFAQPSLVRRTSSGIGDAAGFHTSGGVLEITRANEERRSEWRKWCDEKFKTKAAKRECNEKMDNLDDTRYGYGVWRVDEMPNWKRDGLIPPDYEILEIP